MPTKTYRIRLTKPQRKKLRAVADSKTVAKEQRRRANILLMADESRNGPAFKDADIAEALSCSVGTVERTRTAAHKVGSEVAIERKKRKHSPRRRALDGRGEAELIRIACSNPPEGHAKWSLRLLAGKLVELEIIDSISHETVRETLKKTKSNPGL